MKNKNTTSSEPKYNREITDKIDTLNTHIHHRSFSWRGTSTAIKNGWVKFVLWARTSPISEKMRSSKCFKCYPQISKMPTLTYRRAAFLKEHCSTNFYI